MRKIAFLTGTRAEYGKIKSLLIALRAQKSMEAHIFVTGMHMLEQFGYTYNEVIKDGLGHIFLDEEYSYNRMMDMTLATVIRHFSRFVRNIKPEMIVVHGDRLDALAGALVGAFNNILVAHVEGGEVSGTIDESIRHSISKFAHIHFVANDEAKNRLIQLGEKKDNIHIIGSPDVDIMLGNTLPLFDKVRERYNIPFTDYAIVIFHPVVTEPDLIKTHTDILINALKASGHNYVGIYPNNDPGNETIRHAYIALSSNDSFYFLPSMSFEYFLTLLKNAEFIIGNSSSGIREACIYGIPAVDIGSRQQSRCNPDVLKNVIHVANNQSAIETAIKTTPEHRHQCLHFGSGNSAEAFCSVLKSDSCWHISTQKRFVDIND